MASCLFLSSGNATHPSMDEMRWNEMEIGERERERERLGTGHQGQVAEMNYCMIHRRPHACMSLCVYSL